MEITMRPIATMRSDFPTKFGIPRQSGLVESLHSTIIFEPEYRNADALRGIEVTKPLGIYAFISYICLALPASYILGFVLKWGAMGVACGLPVGLTVAAVLYYTRFRKEILIYTSQELK